MRSTSISRGRGFDRGTNREFIQFLTIARASTSEVKSHLYVALDRKYINPDKFREVYDQTTKAISLIDGFIRYLRTNMKHKTQQPRP